MKKYYSYKNNRKGKILSFPFSLIISLVFISGIFAQFGISTWIHSNLEYIQPSNDQNAIQIFNDSHVGLLNTNDSLRVSESVYGIR